MVERQIYYAGSITNASTEFKSRAKITIPKLERHGRVLTEHLARDDCQEFEKNNIANGVNICDRDLIWLGISHNMVLDASDPSLGAGYELAKKTSSMLDDALVIHDRSKRLTNMIGHLVSPHVEVQGYDTFDQLDSIFADYFKRHPINERKWDNLSGTEGLDGSGKGAMTRAAIRWATERNLSVFNIVDFIQQRQNKGEKVNWLEIAKMSKEYDFLVTGQPTYMGAGYLIRKITTRTDKDPKPYNPITTLDLFGAEREICYQEITLPAVERGQRVWQERGVSASLTYQPVHNEIKTGMSRAITLSMVLGKPGNKLELRNAPNFWLIPEVSVDTALARLDGRSDKQDQTELEGARVQQGVYEALHSDWFQHLYERKGTKLLYMPVDKTEPPAVTEQRAYELISEYMR